ncbi:MAG: class I tRNA ligase family protein, partial [Mycoplasmatales bacterium]
DTLRLYEMFMGPLDASIAWNEDGLDGAKRFIDRVWRLYQNTKIVESCPELDLVYNQTVKKVTIDFEKLAFNTAISQMMVFVNEATKLKKMSKVQAHNFIKLIAPITPHIAEEVFFALGNCESITYSEWPTFDESKLASSDVEIIIQINGKIKAKVLVSKDATKEELKELAVDKLSNDLKNVIIIKEIIVPQKLVNFVVK